MKSRVALFEGTWLKYFKDTPFVPNGPEWPGKSKEYNANYQYPTGDIDKEIDFFLTEAMNAAKEVADATQLVETPEQYNRPSPNRPTPTWICSEMKICRTTAKYSCGVHTAKHWD